MNDTAADREGWPLWWSAKRLLILVALAAAAFILWQLRTTLLMAFGAIVIAVLVLAPADLLRRYLPLGHRWAVTAAVALIAFLVLGLGWLTGSQVQTQFSELWQRLPLGIQEIEQRLGLPVIGSEDAPAQAGEAAAAGARGGAAEDPGAARAGEEAMQPATPVATRLWDWIASYGITVINAVVGTVLVVVAGVFLAARPEIYRRGLVKLFPPSQHQRIGDTLVYTGTALRYWLIGELIAMAIVGTLVGLGTWLIGLPAPLALGLFAGLTEFVPIVGPIVGAIPALLLALPEGGTTVLWTLVLFIAIQQVESNMIAPIVQERMVTIPPAVFLLAVAGFGTLFGILGVILAAPLAVVAYVAVQKLWVRDALHEETGVAGERGK